MLKFDIEKAPPTQAEIDKEKKSFFQLQRAIVSVELVAYVGIVAFLMMGYLDHIMNIMGCLDHIVALSMFTVVLGMFTVVSITFISCRLTSLCPILPSNLDAAIGYCNDYPEIAAYRNKVVALGRELTEGEFEAMEDYIKIVQNRKTKEEIEEKRKALHAVTKNS